MIRHNYFDRKKAREELAFIYWDDLFAFNTAHWSRCRDNVALFVREKIRPLLTYTEGTNDLDIFLSILNAWKNLAENLGIPI